MLVQRGLVPEVALEAIACWVRLLLLVAVVGERLTALGMQPRVVEALAAAEEVSMAAPLLVVQEQAARGMRAAQARVEVLLTRLAAAEERAP